MIESSNLTHTSENINVDNVVKYFQENEAIFTAIMTKIINGIKENKKEFITLFQESIELVKQNRRHLYWKRETKI